MSRFNGLACAGYNRVAVTHETYKGAREAELCAEFIAWMRSEEGHGWWAASQIDELMALFCREHGYTPPPKAKARQLMLHVPGVYRERHSLTGPVFEHIVEATGQTRATVYWIPPSEAVTGPWQGNDLSATCQRPVSDMSATCQRPVNDLSATGQRQVCEGSIR